MTQQEKEFVKFIRSYTKDVHTPHGIISCIENYEGMAKAIIAKYPQILAEKVWEGKTYMIQQSNADGVNYFEYIYSTNGIPKKVEVFIREVK